MLSVHINIIKFIEMISRAHLHISGRVQGVFFRATTRDTAIELGLTGWVKNLPDGRVEAVFEGDKERIEEAIEWCRKGPSYAQVSDVKVRWENPTGESGFEVRY